MLRNWRNTSPFVVLFSICLPLLYVTASISIIGWWLDASWYIANTRCMTNMDFKNKTWKPCTLKIGLQKRCVYINHTKIHCDDWDELGVTIHLISIPMQTEVLPSKETTDLGEMSLFLVLCMTLMGLLFSFDSHFRTFTSTVNMLMLMLLSMCAIKLFYVVTEALIDHRPEVDLGGSFIYYYFAAILCVIGAVTQTVSTLIANRKKFCGNDSKDREYEAVDTDIVQGATVESIEMSPAN